MRTLSTLLHATSDAATTLLNVASAAVAVGAVAAAFTQQLRYGLIVGVGALVFAGVGFGFSLWRTYRPRMRRHSFLVSRKRRARRGAATGMPSSAREAPTPSRNGDVTWGTAQPM